MSYVQNIQGHLRGRVGVLPVAICGGIALAMAGGYYVWREISPQPLSQQHPEPPAPAVPQAASTSILPAVTTLPATRASSTEGTAVRAEPGPAATSAVADSADAASAVPPAGAEPMSITAVPDRERDLSALLLAAWQNYRAGDFSHAQECYHRVLREDVHNRDALLGLAAIAQQQDQDTLAQDYYRQILDLDPDDPLGYVGLSSLPASRDGDAANTESRLQLLLAQHPQAAMLHFALGNLYAGKARWHNAQQAYLDASELEPDNALFAFNLAVSLEHLQLHGIAAQYYQRALQPDSYGDKQFDRALVQRRLDELTKP